MARAWIAFFGVPPGKERELEERIQSQPRHLRITDAVPSAGA